MKTELTQILDNVNILVTVPIALKCRGNGKLIILSDEEGVDRGRQAFLIAIARGCRWQ